MRREDAVRSLLEDGWNRGDFRATAHLLGDYTLHVRGVGRAVDLAGTESIVGAWRAAFPDLRFEVHHVVAAGDEVAVHLTLTGTQHGEWGGRAATGNRLSVPHAMFFRFDGDRLTDVWEVVDSGVMDAQLAAD